MTCLVVTRETHTNLRRGPGLNHPIRYKAIKGQKFEAVAVTPPDLQGYVWFVLGLEHNEIVYVREDVVGFEGDCETLPEVDGAAVRSNVPDCVLTITTQWGANVRSGPNTGYAVLSTLPADTQVIALGRSDPDSLGFIWYQVELVSGALGWVREDLGTLSDLCGQLPDAHVDVDDDGDNVPDVDSGEPLPSTNCIATVLPSIPIANLRCGPDRLRYNVVAKVKGGTKLPLIAKSRPDSEGYIWYYVQSSQMEAWIRSDLVTLDGDCDEVTVVDYETGCPLPPPGNLYRVHQTTVPLTSVHVNGGHKGIDLAFGSGTQLVAPAPCVVVGEFSCIPCTPQKPNFPGNTSAEHGFGYGEALMLRFTFDDLPQVTQDFLKLLGFDTYFVFAVYAHLSKKSAGVGDVLNTGDPIGATGNTGNSTGPHLHLETRVGQLQATPIFFDTWWNSFVLFNPEQLYDVR